VVDLGSGGWTDDNCDYCDQISGEYTLAKVLPCSWRYLAEQVCQCDDPPEWAYAQLVIDLFIAEDIVDGSPYWRLYVQVDLQGCWGSYSKAHYRSAQYNSNDNPDCWDVLDESDVATLTKYYEAHYDGARSMYICAGTMPSTIEARRELTA
jgi:hypothetical protein